MTASTPVFVDEREIKALVVMLDRAKEDEMLKNDWCLLRDITSLLHKLERANDGMLRLSGRKLVIDIRHDHPDDDSYEPIHD